MVNSHYYLLFKITIIGKSSEKNVVSSETVGPNWSHNNSIILLGSCTYLNIFLIRNNNIFIG